MNHEIRVVAILQAKPGKAAELEAALKAAVVPSRAEAGCREYTLHVDRETPERFVFVERWIDMAAIEHHRETKHYKELGAAAADLVLSRQVLLLDEVPGQ
ncbi:putative quinol monooxygenase [Pseudomonas gingeri]|uniref:Antibiotic biosynthesis monooxygenase n=1 Tax=Pseudomonas gingeri TaxID=117681 RepID=A0A7Y7YCH0_9PSED|nr:putative quinol monooxygenase [Pseudomonas gingeri]NWB25617.1 antibiotic biosynthesis monooxygenase [Pseudomonas gingeri]NWC33331.1 antibiotic biosynthesis monooxygenase [Pseudomonas gingeri]NWD06507.1 antibiotic biosynthesis monooxygenase [Pseudomonas gingeri]NWE33213.1 antibiotic biosynthesis monooxygenase [Pseudomonas gingeri]NWE55450.1 antibiotic biosynthesis monooxygenase [Pseudomonas gingeri]